MEERTGGGLTREEEWRQSFEAMSIEELENGRATFRFGQHGSLKDNVAQIVLHRKLEKRREQGEVGTLKKEIGELRDDLRTERRRLILVAIAALAALMTALAAWRQELRGLFKWAMAAMKGP